jgi:hypothetical protein
MLGPSRSPAQESGRGVPGFRTGVVRSPGPGNRTPFNAELEPPAAVIPAQFQATIYEVQAGPAKAGTLDAKALTRQAATPDALLKALGEVGKSRILYRIDQPVNVCSERITLGRSEPVIMGTRTDARGNAINSISYRMVGAILRLSAQAPAKEGDPPQPTVTMSARLSDLPSGDGRGTGEKPMGARGVTFEHGEPLVMDEPVVVVEQSTTGAYVVRYMFSPLDGNPAKRSGPLSSLAEPGKAAPPSSGAAESPKDVLPAQFQATVYEVQATPDKVGTLDAKALAWLAPMPEALLPVLSAVGKTRILYRIDQPVNVYSERIAVMGSEPVVTGTRITANGQPINTTMRQNVGVIIRLSASVPPKGKGETLVTMAVQLSALAPTDVEIGAGQKSTAMRNMQIQHSELLEFNRPSVMVAVSSASAVEQATPIAYVIRYAFRP